MIKQFVGCAPSNFRQGRGTGMKPEAIVIHIICGSLQSARSHFDNPASQVSAHYGVGRDGTVLQFVDENDIAFHAGTVVSPTWKNIKPGVNPNRYTVGIEHEGQPTDDWTETQYQTSAELVADIAARWQIPIDEDHIVLHREIRASKTCPGEKFSRKELIARALKQPLPAPDNFFDLITDVTVIGNANLRDGKPSTTARVDRTLAAGTSVSVVAFTDSGERVNGNACWYRTFDGFYLWAGATSQPQPERPTTVAPLATDPTPVPISSQGCGVPRIDTMLSGGGGAPIVAGDSDRDAVGIVQDLLLGHCFKSMPGIMSPFHGAFGSKTTEAVRMFQTRCLLPVSGSVDADTLSKLVTQPAPDPRATQAYLTLVLSTPFTGMSRVLSLVAQMEGVGRFAALNRNTDGAGLSFGLIQWAQRPGRLQDILKAFRDASRDSFTRIFGDGDATLADELIAHVSSPNGGVTNSGITINPKFDLVSEPWITRFGHAASLQLFQVVQVQTALKAFRASRANLATNAPELTSERAVAFMLDVANQFGDTGAKKLLEAVSRTGMAEDDLLSAIADETVRRMPDKFKAGVRARRDSFLNTTLLSESPFQDAQAATQ